MAGRRWWSVNIIFEPCAKVWPGGIHKDINPANILVQRQSDQAFLIDCDIAA